MKHAPHPRSDEFQLPSGRDHEFEVRWNGKPLYPHEVRPEKPFRVRAATAHFARQNASVKLQVAPEHLVARLVKP